MSADAAFRWFTVVHLESPAGLVAASLDALRDGIAAAPPESLFEHVTRTPLRHPHARDLPANDFARWVRASLQDPETAERLAYAGSSSTPALEELRNALLQVLDGVPARRRRATAPEEASFHFLRCRSLAVPLPLETDTLESAVEAWPRLDLSAVFYHLIESRVLGPETAWLPHWLRACGAARLSEAAERVAATGQSLPRLQREIAQRWRRAQIGARLLRKAEAPEAVRRSEAHETISQVARRLRTPPEEEP
jgi:hypothetical protein